MGIWVQNIPVNPNNPYQLGRHIEHDEANRQFAWPWDKPSRPQQDVVWTDEGPVLNQGATGSCTGNTDADILNTDMFTPVRKAKHSGQYFLEGDAMNFYHQATVISAVGGGQVWPPNDIGSSGPAAAQAGVNDGYFESYLHCFTWSQFMSALETQPVMIGINWYNSMFNVDSNGVIDTSDVGNEANLSGGHEFMVRGGLYSKNLVLMRNHWYGDDNVTPWSPLDDGVKKPGEAYIEISAFKALLADQGDVTVPKGVGVAS